MEYIHRTVDEVMDRRMEAFNAVNIVGPKGCGKTRTATERCRTVIEFQDEERRDGYLAVAETIRDHAPEAWVINYTNPMSICIKTLYETFPGIKAFGCCHEVFGTQKFLRAIYEERTGDHVEDWHEVYVNVTGINHFTWFTEAS